MRFYERGEFKMRFSEWEKRMKSIEELKYFLICILSMLVIPIMTVVYYVVKGKIPERAINIIHFLFLGISFGAIVLTVCRLSERNLKNSLTDKVRFRAL